MTRLQIGQEYSLVISLLESMVNLCRKYYPKKPHK